MRKRILFLSLLLITVFTLFLIMLLKEDREDDLNSTVRGKNPVVNRKYVNKELKSVKHHLFNNPPHRLIISGDSVIILVDTSIFLFPKDLSGKTEIKIPFAGGSGNFYTYKEKELIAGLNFVSRQQYVEENGKLMMSSGEGYYMNAIFLNKKFYSLRFVPVKNKVSVLIDSWNYQTGERKVLLNLNDFLKSEILHCKDCIESVLEGNFFHISDTMAGLYFYRGGYFMTISNDSFLLKKTVVEYPFIEFREKKGELPNGLTAIQCEPDIDAMIQQSACSDGDNIYILSGVIEKGRKDRCVDVYESKTFSYLYSFFPPLYEDAQASEILVKNDYLIVVYDNGAVVSYNNFYPR
jgi:hypothetical protein